MSNKEQIIKIFREKVKGKKPDTSNSNQRHDGRQGHWLERQFNIAANANNSADILGYEMKNETASKITFGDWSANRYIFKSEEYRNYFIGASTSKKQDSFCAIFGKPNTDKENRFSWSGSPCPKIKNYNDFGQILEITDDKDIRILYSYSKDKRDNKRSIVPIQLQKENLEIAYWYGPTSPSSKRKDKCLKEKLEDKFNDRGWFTCKKGVDGSYQKICFGKPMNYNDWIDLVQSGIVFFDSGMYQGNTRPYSQWRANNSYWESLITECYE